MTAPLDSLRSLVDGYYRSPTAEADPWVEWGYENHVLRVARFAEDLAKRFCGRPEFCIAAALVHDLGDAFLSRRASEHEGKSLALGRAALEQAGFSASDADEIIRDIVGPHSCKKDNMPQTLDGKIVATADALSHLSADFFFYMCWLRRDANYQDFRSWAAKKVERAFHRKIFFDEVKQEIEPQYQVLKGLFRE